MYVCTYVCIYVRMSVCMYVCMLCTYVHMYVMYLRVCTREFMISSVQGGCVWDDVGLSSKGTTQPSSQL